MYLEITLPDIGNHNFFFKIVKETKEYWIIKQQPKVGLIPKNGMNSKVKGKDNNILMKISKSQHKFLQEFGLFYVKYREQLPPGTNLMWVFED